MERMLHSNIVREASGGSGGTFATTHDDEEVWNVCLTLYTLVPSPINYSLCSHSSTVHFPMNAMPIFAFRILTRIISIHA